MRKNVQHYIIPSIILYFGLILLVYFFINNHINKIHSEGFTPAINGLYRPYVRKMHTAIDTFKNKYSKEKIVNVFRKIGIY